MDARGWLLLQERDEHAPVAPLQWGLVGGHVDPGEDWDTAVWRELREETGLGPEHLPQGLLLWQERILQHAPKDEPRLEDHWRVWIGRAELTNAATSSTWPPVRARWWRTCSMPRRTGRSAPDARLRRPRPLRGLSAGRCRAGPPAPAS